MKNLIGLGTFIALLPALTFAEPTSGPITIIKVRPVLSEVHLTVTPGTFCETDAFRIQLQNPGGKEMYAAVLLAVAAQKSVLLEVPTSPGCTGHLTVLNSITVLK